MIKYYKTLFFTICLISELTIAQSIHVTGIVKDSLLNPLAFTNIIAKPLSKNIDMTFAITDESGNYKLKLKKNEVYNITISYLGFETLSFKLKAENNIIKNIFLKKLAKQLDEIIVIQKIPILIKQDTILYDVNMFTTGTERKLKQVLKKLPGIEVDENGSVTVLGKKINKLLVDGKTFFGGGTKLGVENIPAGVIDAVQVLDNYSEVDFLKGLTDSDKVAMNIILKKDKKQFAFGEIESGIGNREHYIIHPNVFYYGPTANINFIGDLNDIGVKSFTLKDYFDFEGGMGKLLTDPSSFFKLSNNELIRFLDKKDYRANLNKFGALNISNSINNKLDVSAYSIFSKSKTESLNKVTNQYLYEDFETIEDKTNKSTSNDSFIIARGAINFIPTRVDDISYSGFYKSTKSQKSNNLETSFYPLTNSLSSFRINDSKTIKQNAEWHKKLSRKHTGSVSINYHYNENNPITNWFTNSPILFNLAPLMEDSEYNINNVKKLKLHNLRLFFKHYWVLNNSNHIYTTIATNYLSENYLTNDFQVLTDGNVNNFSEENFGNDLDFKLNDINAGIQYKFKTRKLNLKFGISIHNFNWKVNQSTFINKNKLVFLPDLLAKINFNKSESLRLSYNLISNFSDAPKFANKFQLSRYNKITRGNENLENELLHSARLLYSKFSLFRGIVLNGNIRYIKKIKSIRNEIQLQEIDQLSTAIMNDNPETNWIVSSNIRKELTDKLIVKSNVNVNISKYFQSINNILSKNRSTTSGLRLVFETKFKKLPNFEFGYSKNFNKFSTNNSTYKFTTESPFIRLDYSFLKNFNLKGDYSRIIYKNDHKNSNQIANASLFYQKENSAWGFKLSGTNILGANFNNSNSFTDYVISDNKTYILPETFLFSVIYKL